MLQYAHILFSFESFLKKLIKRIQMKIRSLHIAVFLRQSLIFFLVDALFLSAGSLFSSFFALSYHKFFRVIKVKQIDSSRKNMYSEFVKPAFYQLDTLQYYSYKKASKFIINFGL